MEKLSIQILSVPHHEKLIAEISHDENDVQIEVFSYDDIQIQISLDEYIKILKKAKEKLLK